MAQVTPFSGILYNPDLIPDPSSVMAPPYDVITDEGREALYALSPYNIVRIDYGREENGDREGHDKYSRAAAWLAQWLEERVLVRDGAPAFYGYEVRYEWGGRQRAFRGFFARVTIEPFEKGIILPHEETRSKPKSDRLNLMKATEAHTSAIFSLYHSPQGGIAGILARSGEGRSLMEVTDQDGNLHRIWSISDPGEILQIQKEMADLPVFIADGHHRYETALAYQEEHGGPESASVLMFLANMEGSGLSILPTHRLVKGIRGNPVERLEESTELEPVDFGSSPAKVLEDMGRRQGHSFCLYAGKGRAYLMNFRSGVMLESIPPPLGNLDVTVLHRLILDEYLDASELVYEKDVARAMSLVDNGEYQVAFFLNPTRLSELRDVALDGKRMPPKSTYFYPKLLTGMIMNRLD